MCYLNHTNNTFTFCPAKFKINPKTKTESSAVIERKYSTPEPSPYADYYFRG